MNKSNSCNENIYSHIDIVSLFFFLHMKIHLDVFQEILSATKLYIHQCICMKNKTISYSPVKTQKSIFCLNLFLEKQESEFFSQELVIFLTQRTF